ncbi:MAG: 30S ribosomal protein S18 [Candidatus Pacebacteria bacterium]|nr:30S ribosomal protein S18 [Candidatus Paceibacterota bacterium]
MNKQQCFFSQNNIEQIDYKDLEALKKFINPHGRILSKKRTGLCAKHQRQLAIAIKRARFLALLPFTSS